MLESSKSIGWPAETVSHTVSLFGDLVQRNPATEGGPEAGPLTLGLGWGEKSRVHQNNAALSARFQEPNSRERLWPGGLLAGNIVTQARVTQR
jgi:hypothetical protein